MGFKAMNGPCPKSAIKSVASVKKKLSFAAKIDYNVCKGYTSVNSLVDRPKEVSQPCEISMDPTIPFGTINCGPKTQYIPSAPASVKSPCQDRVINSPNEIAANLNLSDASREQSLEDVVNDIAYRFWKCSKCLSMDHLVDSCTDKICCRSCYRYGHKEKNYFQ
jgi:hypothetical protein